MVSKAQPATARLPRAFGAQPLATRVVGVVLAPLLLGAAAGLALGLSAVAYWVLQVVAVAGGLLGGAEHTGAAAGALRGLAGGALYGGAILLVRAAGGLDDHVSLGDAPGTLVIITAVVGSALGALGGRHRARHTQA